MASVEFSLLFSLDEHFVSAFIPLLSIDRSIDRLFFAAPLLAELGRERKLMLHFASHFVRLFVVANECF